MPDIKSVAAAYKFAESQNAEQPKLVTMEIAGGTVENSDVKNMFKSQQHPAMPPSQMHQFNKSLEGIPN